MNKFYLKDLENETENNDNFRKVVFTSDNLQLVLMTINPGEEIGEETHDVDQFFRVEDGEGISIINGKENKIKDDIAIIVPKGIKHNIINTGKKPLRLYTIYSPPEHKENEIQELKEVYKHTMKLHHAKQIIINELYGTVANAINAGVSYATGGTTGLAAHGAGMAAQKLQQIQAKKEEERQRRIQAERERIAAQQKTYQYRQ